MPCKVTNLRIGSTESLDEIVEYGEIVFKCMLFIVFGLQGVKLVLTGGARVECVTGLAIHLHLRRSKRASSELISAV